MNFIKKLFGSGGGGGGGSETSSSASVDRLEQLGIDEKDLVYRSRSSTSVNRQSGTVAVLQTFNSRSQQTGYTVREVKMSSSKHVVQVLPGLFLGSQEIAQDWSGLQHYNVTHVLNVTIEVVDRFPDKFVYKRVPITDMPSTKILQHFDEAFRFIDTARSQGGVALVHCFYGNSRSASFIIGFLMKTERMRFNDALHYLQILRPDVRPNDGFQRQLREYEQKIFKL